MSTRAAGGPVVGAPLGARTVWIWLLQYQQGAAGVAGSPQAMQAAAVGARAAGAAGAAVGA